MVATMTAYLVSAVRTPIGGFGGALASLSAPALGAAAVRSAVARAGLTPEAVEQVIMGNVIAAGLGQAPARQAGLGAGIPACPRRADRQQGLRLGPHGGHAGGA